MAGLIDILNNLTPEQSRALMAGGASILQRAESGRPFSFGQAMGVGGEAFFSSMDQQRAFGQMMKMRDQSIRSAQMDLDAQERARQQEETEQALLRSYTLTPGIQAARLPGGPTAANAERISEFQPTFDFDGAYAALLAQNPRAAFEFKRKYGPAPVEYDTKLEAVKGADGKDLLVQLSKTAPPRVLQGMSPREKLHFINTGGQILGVGEYSGGKTAAFDNTADPGELLAAATQRRGQDLTNTRARELNALTREGQQSQIVIDPVQGPMLVNKGTGQARQVMMNGQAVPGETAAKKVAAAKNLMPLIGQAEKLIDGATGSYLGAAHDQTARLFGRATDGAQNIAQLRVLEGNIMMAQPRMEGPQSNMDVELYRQMAAQLGDPTVPNATKKAALSTLRTLYEKYDPASTAKPNQGGNVPPDIGALLDKYGGY